MIPIHHLGYKLLAVEMFKDAFHNIRKNNSSATESRLFLHNSDAIAPWLSLLDMEGHAAVLMACKEA